MKPGAWGRLMQACGIAAALVIGVMTVLVGYDVLARNLRLPSPGGIAEASEYGLALATLLAAPWLLWSEQHVRLDLLQMSLSPAAWRRLYRAAALLCLVVSAVLAWYSVAVIVDLRQSGAVVMKAFTFPEWWVYVPAPLCFGLMALEALRQLLRGPKPKAAGHRDLVGDAGLLFGALTVLLCLGLPVAFAFLGVNLVGALLFLGGEPGLMQVVRNGVASVTNFSLTPIPFFVLMGEVLFHTGVAMKAIDAFDNVISRVPGRLSVIAIVAGTVFSAISGLDHRHHRAARRAAAAADAQARLQPEHGDGPDHGHRRRRHADSALGHHRAAGQPGRHLHHRAAGGRRGAGHAAVGAVRRLHRHALLAQPVAWRRPSSSRPSSAGQRWRPLLVYVTPLVAIFVIVIVAMSAGWATPTESAALGALATVAVCVAYRSLSWQRVARFAARHRRHLGDDPVHRHRRDHLLADPQLLGRHQRAGHAGAGLGAVALRRAAGDDGRSCWCWAASSTR